jgi:hypothetical protein
VSDAERIAQARSRLDALLKQAGCTDYSAEEVQLDEQECWSEITADAIAHGDSADDPFYDFVATQNVAVFTFYGPSLSIYVVRGDESSFRSHFEALAMTDVEEAREILARHFNKSSPDILLDRTLTGAWLTPE